MQMNGYDGYSGPPQGMTPYPTMQQPMYNIEMQTNRGHGEYPNHWPIHAIEVKCHMCHHEGLTQVEYHMSPLSWILCCIMLVLGLWPCMFIPFCISKMNEQHHICESCH